MYRHLIGIDEAGRGPLAGPVAVGVVCVPAAFDMAQLDEVDDSKKLTETKREALFVYLRNLPDLQVAVSLVGASTIDRRGIQYAIHLAMRRALVRLGHRPDQTYIQLDGGLHAPDSYVHQETIIKGDAKVKLIGAASIIAKVTRDHYMLRQHKNYPAYGFDKHKGYGTQRHQEAIRQHGLCTLHRATYCH